MAKKGYTAEQIINKLREAEILLSQGEAIALVSKKIGVRRHESRAGSTSKGTGVRKLPLKEAGSRPFPG